MLSESQAQSRFLLIKQDTIFINCFTDLLKGDKFKAKVEIKFDFLKLDRSIFLDY